MSIGSAWADIWNEDIWADVWAGAATSTVAVTTALTLDASLINVTRHSVRYEPRTAGVVRNFRGSVLSAITTAMGYLRVWSIETPDMDFTAAASFEADISTGDLFTVTGTLVGSSTLTAAVANIQREDSALYSRFSFELHESA